MRQNAGLLINQHFVASSWLLSYIITQLYVYQYQYQICANLYLNESESIFNIVIYSCLVANNFRVNYWNIRKPKNLQKKHKWSSRYYKKVLNGD
jgi:hypothetical protein